MELSKEKQKKFGFALINFYKEFLLGSSKAVGQLSNIQKEFPEHYKVMKELKDDPQAIEEITSGLPEEIKDTLLLIIIKASAIGKRMNNLFDLSIDEQKKLSEDINKFAEDVEKRMGALLEK